MIKISRKDLVNKQEFKLKINNNKVKIMLAHFAYEDVKSKFSLN